MTFLQAMDVCNFTEKKDMIKSAILGLLFLIMNVLWIKEEQLYVDSGTSNDTNS